MKSNEEYLKKYYEKRNRLASINELWRMRVTEEEFIKGLEKIRDYEKISKSMKSFNDYHIERSVESQIEVMLMDIPTKDIKPTAVHASRFFLCLNFNF